MHDDVGYPPLMDDAQIERELKESQAAMDAVVAARQRRQAAVAAARDAQWSKYKIAQVLGVAGSTVDSILASVERDQARSR